MRYNTPGRLALFIIVGLVYLIDSSPTAHAAQNAQWLSTASGSWTSASRWSTPWYPNNGEPNPSDSYNAIIATPSTGDYYVDLTSQVNIDYLTLDSEYARLRLNDGNLTVNNDINLLQGGFYLVKGSLQANSININPNAFMVATNGRTYLDTKTINGNLETASRGILHFPTGVTLNGLIENGGAVILGDNQTLTGSGRISNITTAGSSVGGHNITLGPDITFDITRGGPFNIIGTGAMTNYATIETSRSLTTLSSDQLTNYGNINIGDGGFKFSGDWTNLGVIQRSGVGTLQLGGTFTVNDIGTVNGTAGSVTLVGTLQNIGQTLTPTSLGQGWTLGSNANIQGGIIQSPIGQSIDVLNNSRATFVLDNLTLNADLNNLGQNARIINGLQLNRSIIMPPARELWFDSNQTISGTGQITTTSTPSSSPTTIKATGAIQIDPNITLRSDANPLLIQMSGGIMSNLGHIVASGEYSGIQFQNPGFTNRGSIDISNGAALTLSPAHFATDGGQINLTDAQLILTDRFTLDQIPQVNSINTPTKIWGTLVNTGQTLDASAFDQGLILRGGEIEGGTLVQTGANGFGLQYSSTLTGVTLQGDIEFEQNVQGLDLHGVTTLTPDPATPQLRPTFLFPASLFLNDGPQIQGNGIIRVGDAAGSYDIHFSAGGGVIHEGVTISLEASRGKLYGLGLVNRGELLFQNSGLAIEMYGSIINEGQLRVQNNGWLSLYNTITNHGFLYVGPDSEITTTAHSSIVKIDNQGIIEVDGGEIDLNKLNMSNGTIRLINDGSIRVGGEFTNLSQFGNVENTSGQFIFEGTYNGNGSTVDFTQAVGHMVLAWESKMNDLTITGDNTVPFQILEGSRWDNVTLARNVLMDHSNLMITNGATIDGALTLTNNSALSISGALNGQGSLIFADGSRYNRLIGQNNVLTIGPDLTITTDPNSYGEIGYGNNIVTFNGNAIAQGEGASILMTGATLELNGLAEARDNADLHIQADFNNPQGLLRATSGATLHIIDDLTTTQLGQFDINNATLSIEGALDNTAQTIRLTNPNSFLGLGSDSPSVNGVVAGGSIIFEQGGGFRLAYGELNGVDVQGDIVLNGNQSQLKLINGSTFTGNIQMPDAYTRLTLIDSTFTGNTYLTGAFTGLFIQQSGTHEPNGTISLEGDNSSVHFLNLQGSDGPNIGGNTTIRGGGAAASIYIRAYDDTITNFGAIIADQAGSRLNLYVRDTGTFTNQGLIQVSSGATLSLGEQYSSYTSGGTNGPDGVIRAQNATLLMSGPWINQGLLQINNASLTLSQTLQLQGGTLQGGGSVTGDIQQTGGAISPGLSPGTLTINGDYTQVSGTLQIEIGGTDPGAFDILQVNGDVSLAGALNITLLDDFLPTLGQSWTILQSTSTITGHFSSVTGWRTPNNLTLIPNYIDDHIDLIAAIPADFNLDEQVDVQDLSIWATGFGATDALYQNGDADLNGQVDVSDLSAWATNFGSTAADFTAPILATLNSATAIPEPSTFTLIGLSILGVVRRKKRPA